MKTQHTPGPWVEAGKGLIVADKTGEHIVDALYLNDNEGNVKVIAASPELLDALITARELLLNMGRMIRELDADNQHYEFWTNDENYIPGDEFQIVESAIAKATGNE